MAEELKSCDGCGKAHNPADLDEAEKCPECRAEARHMRQLTSDYFAGLL